MVPDSMKVTFGESLEPVDFETDADLIGYRNRAQFKECSGLPMNSGSEISLWWSVDLCFS